MSCHSAVKVFTIKITFHSAKPFKCGPNGWRNWVKWKQNFSLNIRLLDFLSDKCLRVRLSFKDSHESQLLFLFILCRSIWKAEMQRSEQSRDDSSQMKNKKTKNVQINLFLSLFYCTVLFQRTTTKTSQKMIHLCSHLKIVCMCVRWFHGYAFKSFFYSFFPACQTFLRTKIQSILIQRPHR